MRLEMVREVCRWHNMGRDVSRYIIRSKNHYEKGAAWYERLVNAALKDFPKLKKKDIRITIFQGSYIKGFAGIDFAPPSEVLKNYSVIHTMEQSV